MHTMTQLRAGIAERQATELNHRARAMLKAGGRASQAEYLFAQADALNAHAALLRETAAMQQDASGAPGDDRPPGAHVYMPDVEWHPASDAPPGLALGNVYPRPHGPGSIGSIGFGVAGPAACVEKHPLPIGMIEPARWNWDSAHKGGPGPWVFWAVVLLSFACVLAKAGGLL